MAFQVISSAENGSRFSFGLLVDPKLKNKIEKSGTNICSMNTKNYFLVNSDTELIQKNRHDNISYQSHTNICKINKCFYGSGVILKLCCQKVHT